MGTCDAPLRAKVRSCFSERHLAQQDEEKGETEARGLRGYGQPIIAELRRPTANQIVKEDGNTC